MCSKSYLQILYAVGIGLVFQGLAASGTQFRSGGLFGEQSVPSIYGGIASLNLPQLDVETGISGGAKGGVHGKGCAKGSTEGGGEFETGAEGGTKICLFLFCASAEGYGKGKVKAHAEGEAEGCLEGGVEAEVHAGAGTHSGQYPHRVLYPRGTVMYLDGTVVYPDGTIVYPDGTRRRAYSTERYPPYVAVEDPYDTETYSHDINHQLDFIPRTGRIAGSYKK